MTRVSIIIVNYNTFKLTTECIQSVIEYTLSIEYEIILVDNASKECDPAEFTKLFPQVKLIASDTNGGFAYGNNLGIGRATGKYILLLNSDTILQEDSIGKSVAKMEQDPKMGVLTCRMIFPDGAIQHFVRPFKTIKWELFDLFRFIPLLMPYRKRARLMQGKYFRQDFDMECDWVGGAFFLFPATILKELPGNKLDDRFFMYGEDQLWCEQIHELGYIIFFYSGTTIIHINSGSTNPSKQLAVRKVIMQHELQIMKWRHGNGLYYYTYKVIYVMKESVRNFVKGIVYRLTGKMMKK